MKITIGQLNPVVGDIRGNSARIAETFAVAAASGADLAVFTELGLTGYPPKDLLERPWFMAKVAAAIEELRRMSEAHPATGLLFGAPVPTGAGVGKPLYNAALLIQGGKVLLEQHKSLLPTYDVFDEARYFAPAPEVHVVPFKGERLGVSICEDAWNDPGLWPEGRLYGTDPIEVLAGKGATLLVNISASPFSIAKDEVRFGLVRNHARKHRLPFIMVNQVGGNDELLFDGRSFGVGRDGEPAWVAPPFVEDIRAVDPSAPGQPGLFVPQERAEAVYEALVMGLRDYTRKCGFARAVVGLSGGIDSALTCCLAKDALGAENVLAVTMPSPYSSRGSVDDSLRLAANLGIRCEVVRITSVFRSYLETLKPHFAGRPEDVTEENIQARVRGNILMAFSNKDGSLVLSTGNKSEMAVGYCTLYGDMSGGLAVLSDVPKTLVYELAAHVNRSGVTIPRAIIDKPPSAELRPGQLDEDTLPPYPVLDKILAHYIEDVMSVDEITRRGFDEATVRWVAAAVDRNEFKRRQAAPGLKVTSKALGAGRRMPMAAKFEY